MTISSGADKRVLIKYFQTQSIIYPKKSFKQPLFRHQEFPLNFAKDQPAMIALHFL